MRKVVVSQPPVAGVTALTCVHVEPLLLDTSVMRESTVPTRLRNQREYVTRASGAPVRLITGEINRVVPPVTSAFKVFPVTKHMPEPSASPMTAPGPPL